MHYSSTILAIAPLALLARADGVDFDRDNVPRVCRDICRPIDDLSDRCEVDLPGNNNDREEDQLEVQCFCSNTSFDVAGTAALCHDCIRQNRPTGNNNNDDDDDDDELEDYNDALRDIENIVSTCSFTATTSWASTATSLADVTVSATRPTAASQLTTTFSAATLTSATDSPTETGASNDNSNDSSNTDEDSGAAVGGAALSLLGLLGAGGVMMLA